MRRARAACAGLVVAAATTACASPERSLRAQWGNEWNARVAASAELMAHPCGDFAFDPWADSFLAACPLEVRAGDECDGRARWVRERARQCRDWKSWLLRNHNQQVRDDTTPEPETRVY